MESKWYAVYTRSRWEKKVVEQLNRCNIETYCPLNRVVRQWSDRRKVVEEPLFTSYVFLKVTERQMNEVRLVLGVVNFVYWLGKPAVILDTEIQDIKDFLSNHYNVKLEKLQLHIHDAVRILNGPFVEMEGSIISIKKKSVRLLLPSLRFFMTAEVEIENVSKIPGRSAKAQHIAING